MKITYRDDIGYIITPVDGAVTFCDGFVYFTDGNGDNWKIPVENVACIEEE